MLDHPVKKLARRALIARRATQAWQQISGTCFWDGAGVLAYCGIDLAECFDQPPISGGVSTTGG